MLWIGLGLLNSISDMSVINGGSLKLSYTFLLLRCHLVNWLKPLLAVVAQPSGRLQPDRDFSLLLPLDQATTTKILNPIAVSQHSLDLLSFRIRFLYPGIHWVHDSISHSQVFVGFIGFNKPDSCIPTFIEFTEATKCQKTRSVSCIQQVY